MNYFNTIETALRALRAQQKSMQITGHNVANANTEGYSRQRAVHSATDPYAYPGFNMPGGAGQIGTGVKICEIQRIRDLFIDSQIREETNSMGRWDQLAEGLERIELIFNEPSDSSLSFALNEFWSSLQDLSENPSDDAFRTTVRQRAMNVIDAFHSLYDQLDDYRIALNGDVNTTVAEINSLAKRIADLNNQIVNVVSTGQNPNDLMDKRDLLFERMSELVDVRGHIDRESKTLNINLGGMTLVDGTSVHELEIIPQGRHSDIVQFAGTGIEAEISEGKLAGLLELRDDIIQDYIDRLNEMAQTLNDEFNAVHSAGYGLNGSTGVEFFQIVDTDEAAKTIGLTSDILDETDGLNNIAAARDVDGDGTPDLPGDGSNALLLSDVIREEKLFNSGEATLLEYYQSTIATLGIDSQRARQMVSNQEVLVEQLKNQRESISGVSLDEEMTNLIKFQQAYNAAAKVITTTNSILDSLMTIVR